MTVQENSQTRRWEIVITTRDEGRFRADVASDGTLRVIALLAALYDPRYRGLLCFEEPENGVHPGRLRVLLGYLKALVTDPQDENPVSWSPLSQVLLNSHSPLVLDSLDPVDCVLLEPVSLIEPIEGQQTRATSRITQFRRVVGDDDQQTPFDGSPLAPATRSQVQQAWAKDILERPA